MMDLTSQSLMWMFMRNNNDNNNYFIYYISILSILIPYISRVIPFDEISEYLKECFTKKDNNIKIIISSHEVSVMSSFSTMPSIKISYSKRFLAIIDHLNDLNCPEIECLTEIMTFNSSMKYYSGDDDKFTLMPINTKKILVCKEHDIYIQINTISSNTDDDKKSDKDNIKSTEKITKKTEYRIIISKEKKTNFDLKILNDFLKNVEKEYDNKLEIKNNDNKLYIFQYKGYEKDESTLNFKFTKHEMTHNKDLNTNIFFEGKDKLREYIKPFKNDPLLKENPGEEKYKRSGFTFKCTMIFDGHPGCGKTSTIKAIAKESNRHCVIIKLSQIKTCEELENIFHRREFNGIKLKSSELCYVLEDVDAFENNFILTRKNDTESKKNDEVSDIFKLNNMVEVLNTPCNKNIIDDKVNLSCFLNILDGIIELHGIMIIMTTNHLEKIDEALIRPGRFDFKHTFKKASKKIILEMLKFKFEIDDIEKYHQQLKIKDEILSPAEVQSICFKNNNIKDAISEIIYACQAHN